MVPWVSKDGAGVAGWYKESPSSPLCTPVAASSTTKPSVALLLPQHWLLLAIFLEYNYLPTLLSPPLSASALVAEGTASSLHLVAIHIMSSRRTQRRTQRRRDPPPRPIFGIEIEVFVKVKRAVEDDVIRARNRGSQLPDFWRIWDFDLSNAEGSSRATLVKQFQQRNCVKAALTSCINDALGHNSGWKVVGDASLKEHKLTVPPDARHWCKTPPFCWQLGG